jgi:predicted transcriptional regulator
VLAIVSRLGHTLVMVKKQRAVRIKEQDLERLEKLAKKEHETVSFLIQTAIREFLDRKESK